MLTDNSIDERWPELLQALFVASQSPDVGQRQSAFRIFTATPGIIEQQHENVVIGAFTKGFKDDDVSVRFPEHLAPYSPSNLVQGQAGSHGGLRVLL